MEQSKKPSAEELLRKILELEKRHVHLKQEISKLIISGNPPKPDNRRARNSAKFEGGYLASVLAPGSLTLWPVIRRLTMEFVSL